MLWLALPLGSPVVLQTRVHMYPTESSEIILITAAVKAVLLGLSKQVQEHISWAVSGPGLQHRHAIGVYTILGEDKSTPPAGARGGPGGGLSRGPVAWACHPTSL